MVSEITRFYCKPGMTSLWFIRQGALHTGFVDEIWMIDPSFIIMVHLHISRISHTVWKLFDILFLLVIAQCNPFQGCFRVKPRAVQRLWKWGEFASVASTNFLLPSTFWLVQPGSGTTTNYRFLIKLAYALYITCLFAHGIWILVKVCLPISKSERIYPPAPMIAPPLGKTPPNFTTTHCSSQKGVFLTPDRVYWTIVRENWFTGMDCSSVEKWNNKKVTCRTRILPPRGVSTAHRFEQNLAGLEIAFGISSGREFQQSTNNEMKGVSKIQVNQLISQSIKAYGTVVLLLLLFYYCFCFIVFIDDTNWVK